MDGGVRRGTDVFKALALGASGVFVSKICIFFVIATEHIIDHTNEGAFACYFVSSYFQYWIPYPDSRLEGRWCSHWRLKVKLVWGRCFRCFAKNLSSQWHWAGAPRWRRSLGTTLWPQPSRTVCPPGCKSPGNSAFSGTLNRSKSPRSQSLRVKWKKKRSDKFLEFAVFKTFESL